MDQKQKLNVFLSFYFIFSNKQTATTTKEKHANKHTIQQNKRTSQRTKPTPCANGRSNRQTNTTHSTIQLGSGECNYWQLDLSKNGGKTYKNARLFMALKFPNKFYLLLVSLFSVFVIIFSVSNMQSVASWLLDRGTDDAECSGVAKIKRGSRNPTTTKHKNNRKRKTAIV